MQRKSSHKTYIEKGMDGLCDCEIESQFPVKSFIFNNGFALQRSHSVIGLLPLQCGFWQGKEEEDIYWVRTIGGLTS